MSVRASHVSLSCCRDSFCVGASPESGEHQRGWRPLARDTAPNPISISLEGSTGSDRRWRVAPHNAGWLQSARSPRKCAGEPQSDADSARQSSCASLACRCPRRIGSPPVRSSSFPVRRRRAPCQSRWAQPGQNQQESPAPRFSRPLVIGDSLGWCASRCTCTYSCKLR